MLIKVLGKGKERGALPFDDHTNLIAANKGAFAFARGCLLYSNGVVYTYACGSVSLN